MAGWSKQPAPLTRSAIYSEAELRWILSTRNLRRTEVLNKLWLMLMNYVSKQSRDHADSEYASYLRVDRQGDETRLLVTNKFAHKQITLYSSRPTDFYEDWLTDSDQILAVRFTDRHRRLVRWRMSGRSRRRMNASAGHRRRRYYMWSQNIPRSDLFTNDRKTHIYWRAASRNPHNPKYRYSGISWWHRCYCVRLMACFQGNLENRYQNVEPFWGFRCSRRWWRWSSRLYGATFFGALCINVALVTIGTLKHMQIVRM